MLVKRLSNKEKQYNSNDLCDLYAFYNNFKTVDELINFIKAYPLDNNIKIKETGPDSDIAVVVPTSNSKREITLDCIKLYKDFKVILVESGPPYFRFAHSVNEGIKVALKNRPKWVVISNDDIYEIDKIASLRSALLSLDPKKICVVYTNPESIQSHNITIARERKPLRIIRKIRGGYYHAYQDISDKFSARLDIIHNLDLKSRLKAIFLYKNLLSFRGIGSFMILSGEYLKRQKGELLDINFLNGYEDVDLSYRLYKENVSCAYINFRIGVYSGFTLGAGRRRLLRDMTGRIYFNYKWRRLCR